MPSVHGRHTEGEVAPSPLLLYVPAGHGVHDVLALLLLYVPGGQTRHSWMVSCVKPVAELPTATCEVDCDWPAGQG